MNIHVNNKRIITRSVPFASTSTFELERHLNYSAPATSAQMKNKLKNHHSNDNGEFSLEFSLDFFTMGHLTGRKSSGKLPVHVHVPVESTVVYHGGAGPDRYRTSHRQSALTVIPTKRLFKSASKYGTL